MTKAKAAAKRVDDGLIGLFGHYYMTDPESPSKQMIQTQFRIIRKMDGERYVVQFYSFWDGEPTCVGVYSEAELLGEDVRLYADHQLWRDAYDAEYHGRR